MKFSLAGCACAHCSSGGTPTPSRWRSPVQRAAAPRQLEGRLHLAAVAVPPLEVDGGGQHRCPAPERERDRPGGEGRALAEERHLPPLTHGVPAAHPANDAV